MPYKTIFLSDERTRVSMAPPLAADSGAPLLDEWGRPLRDLRISITDRCNFRCRYCMPREVFQANHAFLPQSAVLSFEEITRLARVFVAQGVDKIRLTGGEPLLRKDIEQLIASLSDLRTPGGSPVDLTLTTNGSLLARKAAALRSAGLRRITVSLDALDEEVFQAMTDSGARACDVLAGIEAALHAGLHPVKVNMVVQRGVNEHQILPMARRFRHTGAALRFIEYMDVGSTNGWRAGQVVPSDEILHRLQGEFSLQPHATPEYGETAQRWHHTDGSGEVGLISSVTKAFCGHCTRARLSTEGRLYLCLFANQGEDLREPLRNGCSDEALGALLRAAWSCRTDRYSALRGQQQGQAATAPKVEMHYIGG